MEFTVPCDCSSEVFQPKESQDQLKKVIINENHETIIICEPTELTYEQKRLENQNYMRKISFLACRNLAERYSRMIKCKFEPKPKSDLNNVLFCRKITSRSDVLKTLSFILSDEMAKCNIERFYTLLDTFMSFNAEEFKLDELQHVIVLMEYLAIHSTKNKMYETCFQKITINCATPMIIEGSLYLENHFNDLISLFDLIGYLLVAVDDGCAYDSLFNTILSLLFTHNCQRRKTAIQSEHCIKAVENSIIIDTVVQMLAICSSNRYSKYVELAAAFASLSSNIRIKMLSQNILENIFCRFNPYFLYSNKVKPDIGLHDPNDGKVLLGDAEVHINTTLSLLMMLLWSTRVTFNEKESPNVGQCFKTINDDALRSFEWAFRLECSRRDRKHQRLIMATVIVGLLDCYGPRISFCIDFIKDLMRLAVQTEIPMTCTLSWISKVKWNTSKIDLAFKRSLMLSCLLYIKNFPHNNVIIDKTNFIQGLVFIIDPNLATLYGWGDTLFTELKIFTIKVLVYSIPFNRENILNKYNIIQRTLCLLDSYNLRKFDVNTLYWNVRILDSLMDRRHTSARNVFMEQLHNIQGEIVLINLCEKLIQNGEINSERRDIIVARLLRILNSCSNYEHTKSNDDEQHNIYLLAMRLLSFVTTRINRNYSVSRRLLISLLNLIWETVTRNEDFLDSLTSENGIHSILNVIDVECPSVQCIGLALLTDLAHDQRVVLQLYSWRGGHKVYIRKLLAKIFREECTEGGIQLTTKTNIIEDLEYPLMSSRKRMAFEKLKMTDPVLTEKFDGLSSITVMEIPGSRMSKVHALLCIMQKYDESDMPFENTTTLVDNIVLKLAEYYLICKLGEIWKEARILFKYLKITFLPSDAKLLNDIFEVYSQWPMEIKRQQEYFITESEKKNIADEQEFYKCLRSVNIMKAWDALNHIKGQALTSDRNQMKHWMQSQILDEQNKLKCMERKIGCQIIRTLKPEKVLLRDGNVTVKSLSMEDQRGEIKSSMRT